jgi:hypothetical protein
MTSGDMDLLDKAADALRREWTRDPEPWASAPGEEREDFRRYARAVARVILSEPPSLRMICAGEEAAQSCENCHTTAFVAMSAARLQSLEGERS